MSRWLWNSVSFAASLPCWMTLCHLAQTSVINLTFTHIDAMHYNLRHPVYCIYVEMAHFNEFGWPKIDSFVLILDPVSLKNLVCIWKLGVPEFCVLLVYYSSIYLCDRYSFFVLWHFQNPYVIPSEFSHCPTHTFTIISIQLRIPN